MKHRSGVVAGFVVASFFVFGNAIGAGPSWSRATPIPNSETICLQTRWTRLRSSEAPE